MFIVLVLICMKKDLTIFMKMSSIGAGCVTCLIIFVIIYGFLGISDTKYKIYASPGGIPHPLDPKSEYHNILLFNSGFSSLAGSLCAGYFMH